MHKVLQSILLVSSLSLSTYTVDSQSTVSDAMQYHKNRKYDEAIEEYKKSLIFFKSDETPLLDSIAFIYKKLQFCYISKMKIDSTLSTLEEAESYFYSKNSFKKYIEFKMARSEVFTMMGNAEGSLALLEELIQFDYITNSDKVRCYLRLGNQYLSNPEKEKSYFFINESLRLAQLEKDSSILGNIYDSYAGIEHFFGNKQEAIDNYLKAIPFLEQYNKHYILATLFRKVGYVFYESNNYSKAREYAYMGLELAKEHNIKREEYICGVVIGRMLVMNGEIDKGIELLEAPLEYFKKRRINAKLLEIESYLFQAYQKKGNLAKAEAYMVSSAKTLENVTQFGYVSKYHFRALDYYVKLRNRKKAKHHLLVLDTMLEDKKYNPDLFQFFYFKSKYERVFGNYAQALDDMDTYITFKDSIQLASQDKFIHDLEGKYKKNEQDKEIALLNSENELKASRLSKQRLAIFGGSMALLIFGFLSAFIYRLYKKVNSQNTVIKTALEEKDTLLREIHHRVKNNLQVISSLLALQSRYVLDEKALSALKQGQDRVQSMALIHQDLYENNDMTGVNTHLYLEQLMENLFDSYNIDEDKISYSVEVDEIVLDVDTMIPLGLIINELVSNSLKHAFKEKQFGEITVKLNEKNNKLHLEVSDDGQGVSSISEMEGKSFGFELIKAFTKKLKAEMNITSKDGLNIEIIVSNYKKAA